MSSSRVIVLKFGGSVLADETRLSQAVHEIYRWRRDGWQVVGVVSALAGATNARLATCDRIHDRASRSSTATLAALGELECAALLGLHLDRAGIAARVLTPAACGLRAEGDPLDATPIDVDVNVVQRALREDGVAIVPGFLAVDRGGRTVVLGRGGSDLTAFFLAQALIADRCRLIKDVDGVYESNPAHEPAARKYATLDWQDAERLEGRIVQPKALDYARTCNLPFEVARFNGTYPTRVGGGRTTFAVGRDAPARRRVALLGLGVVGRGVFELVNQLPHLFEVTGIAVRRPERHIADPRIAPLLTTDALELACSGADIVVEAIGGEHPPYECAVAALTNGADLVTANKALLAAHGPALRALAQERGCRLHASAAVGGGTPILERIAAVGERLQSVRAILNGTTNYVLGRCATGTAFSDAVHEAQELGFAERDPTRDLSGGDAVDKLHVIAGTLGSSLLSERIVVEPLSAAALAERRSVGCLRHVASMTRAGDTWRASVALESVPLDDPLSRVEAEDNLALLTLIDGSTEVVRGKGAGRWPTGEAVVADLLTLARPGPGTYSVVPRSAANSVLTAASS